jgi:hypothetical protein
VLEDFTTLARRVNGLQAFQPRRWETTRLRPASEGVDGQDFLFEHSVLTCRFTNGPGHKPLAGRSHWALGRRHFTCTPTKASCRENRSAVADPKNPT